MDLAYIIIAATCVLTVIIEVLGIWLYNKVVGSGDKKGRYEAAKAFIEEAMKHDKAESDAKNDKLISAAAATEKDAKTKTKTDESKAIDDKYNPVLKALETYSKVKDA